ncbi:MAG: hypothetical protein ACRBBR_07775, partial [Cellvibrionaceae bacterium]
MIEPDVYIFTLLTTIGLIIKWAIWFTVINPGYPSKTHSAVVLLIFVQLVQSAIEYLGYFIPLVSTEILIYPLIAYYICVVATLFLIPYIIILTLKIKTNNIVNFTYCSTFIAFILLFCATDMIIIGAKYNGITFTRVAGEYYWFFQTLVLASFIYSIALLVYFKIKKPLDFSLRIKISNIFVCYIGVAIFCISIIFIMPHFERVNAVGILPILMGMFLFGLAHSVSRKNFIDFTCWLPFSKRRRMINRLIKPLITVCEDGVDIDPEH